MDKSFFGGSENLYKYLVSIGVLLFVLSIYYPLKQKQELEILKINLQSDLEILNLEIKENKEKIEQYKNIKIKDINLLNQISIKHKENLINHTKTIYKQEEIKNKSTYIEIYKILFWGAIIISIVLLIFGFCKWLKAKKIEDEKLKIEKDILDVELKIKQNTLNNINNNSDNSVSGT